MNTREHLTMEGLAKIVNIKEASMNKGLSGQLKEQFLDVVLQQSKQQSTQSNASATNALTVSNATVEY
jgi:hypothetical protein